MNTKKNKSFPIAFRFKDIADSKKTDSRKTRFLKKKLSPIRCQLSAKQGFTLMEVLVALAVLSLGLVLVLQIISASLQAEGLSNFLTKATFLAQEKLAEQFMSDYSELKDASGDFGETHPGFNWETKITSINLSHPENLDPDEDELRKIELNISWKVRNKLQKLNMVTFVARREP